jgi:hypothetical protein
VGYNPHYCVVLQSPNSHTVAVMPLIWRAALTLTNVVKVCSDRVSLHGLNRKVVKSEIDPAV